MACPDELTLDLWLAGALPSQEAADVATHAHTCATCAAAERAAHALDAEIHAALALDAEELAYLSGLELAASWRVSPAAAALSWGWIALVGAIAGFAAWLGVAQLFGSAIAAAAQVGLGTLPLDAALGFAFSLGQALLDVSRNPALGLNQPLLALLALALLFWPRHLIPHRSTHS
jgi:anti-sigma factor RsiW